MHKTKGKGGEGGTSKGFGVRTRGRDFEGGGKKERLGVNGERCPKRGTPFWFTEEGGGGGSFRRKFRHARRKEKKKKHK